MVETDADTVRDRYVAALETLPETGRARVVGRGGRFVRAVSDEDPVDVVRAVVASIRFSRLWRATRPL